MLHIHRAERADQLVAALADTLATPLPDPLTTEVVAVPSRGIERWISQELSGRLGTGALGDDGVCANVAFPFPARLIHDAVAAGSGIAPEKDPWLPERLAWPLLSIVDEDPDASTLGPLGAHVGAGGGPRAGDGVARRLGAVRHVADLFDRYGVHRPEMVCRWHDGADVGADDAPLHPRHRWQPVLWRAVRERLGVPSFAERRASALSALRQDPDLLAPLHLPDRLAMFGLTALPATFFDVAAAIGVHRDVHLLVLHPSRVLWERVAEASGAARTTSVTHALPLREQDATARLPRNPLLRSWGRDVRELQLVTPASADAALVHHDRGDSTDAGEQSLLRRLQADVRADRHPGPPTGAGKPPLRPDDRSVQLHDCHGRMRQVEVLREAILHLLADAEGLEPRDIIVMCPDIETFAPLITAVFGAEAVVPQRPAERPSGAERPGAAARAPDAPPALRVRLADRALRRTNPVLEVVSQLLDLVDGRITASQVLDLVTREPVRRRFGILEDDLDTLETWVADLQIRWGFDAAHRQRQGLPALDAHTWSAGLQRLLLGAAMADEDLRLVEHVAPYDGIEGQTTDLAGRFVELIARLEEALARLTDPRPVSAWRDVVGEVADRLTDTGPDGVGQRLQLHRILDELVDEATVGATPSPVDLDLAEVRTVLAQRLAGRPSTTSHRTGDLTFSTLVPMRSVPHRVVCLLGLDDGAFPRAAVPDSDDVLAQAPRVGDRDPRSEDRQLLLDALMAATDALVVTFAGRDVRTNEDRPPAVPVDELRDVIDRTVAVAGGRPRDHVTVRHPLDGHDPRNFTAHGLPAGVERWGFDAANLAAAQARCAPPQPSRPFLQHPLPPPADDTVALDDLVAFLQHPAKAFVTQRLELSLPSDDDDTASDAIPATLKGLDAWKVGDPVVQAWLDGHDRDRAVGVVRARGLIPPGDLATGELQAVLEEADRIVSLCGRIGVVPGGRRTVDVDVALPDGRHVVGTVPDVVGWRQTTVSYSRVRPKHRLAAWARWLALLATSPSDPWAAATVGRHPYKKRSAQAVLLKPRDGEPAAVRATAVTHLERLVDLYDRGMRSPIPLYCAASAKSAEQRYRDEPPTRYVFKEWETKGHAPFPSEDLDPYHVLLLGGQVPTDDLFTELCQDGQETSWADDDRRFVAYAWRLWEPILVTEWRCEG